MPERRAARRYTIMLAVLGGILVILMLVLIATFVWSLNTADVVSG